ncbi:MAG: hypothetical protein D6812_01050 [Deltaproteobacteria bacterium]|nr:MAG: hypothetical protein D6812_01050 [Deltaproteobacteria bacterium]
MQHTSNDSGRRTMNRPLLCIIGVVALCPILLAPLCGGGGEPYATLDFTGTSMPDAGGTGTLTATPNGGTEIQVSLHDIPEGDHAWHVHEGSCMNQGGIAIDLSSLVGDLHAGADGTVETTVTIDEAIGTDGFYFNIHEFSTNDGVGPGITCADVVPVME